MAKNAGKSPNSPEKCDVFIVGLGFAGLSAAIYSARYNFRTIAAGEIFGGLIIDTHLVENYPGFTAISGLELMEHFKEHVKFYENIEVVEEKVESIEKKWKKFFAVLKDGRTFESKAVIIATGTKRRLLNVPGEKELSNKGVSYCARCDAFLFKNKEVVVVGSGDSATKEALLLSEHAKKVTVLVRKDKLKAEPINLSRVEKKKDKIKVKFNAEIAEIIGKGKVEAIKLKDGSTMKVDGVFIEIGHLPQTELAQKLGCALDEHGEIKVDRYARTNVPGVFAAGDCVDTHWKQGIVSAAEGAHAANSAYNFVSNEDIEPK